MISFAEGNLLDADVEALVNAVNCVGVMGKGIALQFKLAFPGNFREYEKACRAGQVRLGRMFIVPTGKQGNPAYIVNFPTKYHWRDKSRLEDIEAGLSDLVSQVRRLGIRSIAVPALGCGLGGLEWPRVKPLIVAAFEQLPDVMVMVFGPHDAPPVEK
jgi:O-acetyl-ADP-ribose deacetylase (regulator of RNase III)